MTGRAASPDRRRTIALDRLAIERLHCFPLRTVNRSGGRLLAARSASTRLRRHQFELEIIDAIDKRSLERIREDRNLCVHPSLRPFSEEYHPTPEVARAHLAVALDVLLIIVLRRAARFWVFMKTSRAHRRSSRRSPISRAHTSTGCVRHTAQHCRDGGQTRCTGA